MKDDCANACGSGSPVRQYGILFYCDDCIARLEAADRLSRLRSLDDARTESHRAHLRTVASSQAHYNPECEHCDQTNDDCPDVPVWKCLAQARAVRRMGWQDVSVCLRARMGAQYDEETARNVVEECEAEVSHA